MIPKLAPRNSPRNYDAHSLQEETGAVFFSEEDATHDVDDLVMTENSNDEEKSSTSSESTGENSNHNTNTAQAFFESSTSTTSYLHLPPSLPSSNTQHSDDPPLSPTKAPASLPLRRPLAIVNAATPAPPISPVPQPQLQAQQAQFRLHPQRVAQLQQPHFTLTPPVAAARPMVVAAKRHATAVRPKRPKRQRRRSRLRRQFPGNPPTSLWSDNHASSSSISNLMDEGGFSSSSSDSEPESLPFLPSASKKEREQQYWDMCYGSSSSSKHKKKKQNGLSTIDPQPTPSSAIMFQKLTPSWSASRKPPQKSWYVVCLPCIVCLYL